MEARELSKKMDQLAHLAKAPASSFSSLLERVAAIVLQQAVHEDGEIAGLEAPDVGTTRGNETSLTEPAGTEAADADAHVSVCCFSDVACQDIMCVVEVRQRRLAFRPPDERNQARGVPHALPYEVVQGVHTSTCSAVASCVITISPDSHLVEIHFHAQSAPLLLLTKGACEGA